MLEPLAELARHCHHNQPARLVAFTPKGELTWGELARAVNQWRPLIAPIEEPSVLFREIAGESLIAALLACWQCQKTAVLASDATIPLTKSVYASTTEETPGAQATGIDLSGLLPPAATTPALVLYTSGSSGAPVAIAKTFAQLDAELAMLEALWGRQLDQSVVVTMASRHHMFGLPFSLLWPVARGTPFYSERIHYSQSLEALAQRFELTLVASPVQLEHLPDNLDWPCLKRQVSTIFCAGALLPKPAAERCQQQLTHVTEVYGSTETGALAWRQQLENPAWQCLPGVSVTTDQQQHLCVKGPAVTADQGGEFTVADQAVITGQGQFNLLGRADRIVKIAANRVSLNTIEQQLNAHPWVTECQALQLKERKGRLGAVVVLNAEGKALLIDQGRKKLNRALTDHLHSEVMPAAIPRYWRYASRLPRNTQGKVTNKLLTTLFDPQSQPRLPEVLSVETDGGDTRLTLYIPDTLAYFEGHFPGQGVVPGVAQIAWVEHFGRQHLGALGIFIRLENLKFQNIMQPGLVVELSLTWQADKNRLLFNFSSPDRPHASGRLVYDPGAQADEQ